ncbi:MAG TPA: OmpA family protein [Chitinophagales bacterium]|nr:OmpA family protein [Chitinophagales bacterium]
MGLSIAFLFIILSCSAFSQNKLLDTRKHFQFRDGGSFQVGEVKILSNWIYERSKLSILDSVEIFLKHHPAICIEVGCHTDSKGNDAFNLKLSQERAQAFVDSLENRWIDPVRFVAKGYGETFPIAPNEINGKDYPDGRQQNRRIELKIISIDGYPCSLDYRKHFEYSDTSFEVAEVKILCCIYFAFGTAELWHKSFASIDSLIDFLNSHPRLNIEIGNNTDPRGTEEEKQKLSQDRAESLMNYLIGKGIPDYRLQAKGYGSTFRLYNTWQHLNRRTEIKITSISPPLQSLDIRKHFEYTDTSFEVGQIKNLHNVHFGFGGGTPFLPGFYPIMDCLLNFLYYHPELKIEIGNHTDNKGNEKYNLRLSQARSQSIVDYLMSKGVSPDRLSAKGYGESFFLVPNETPDGKDNPAARELNRRTELKITAINPNEKLIRPSLLNPGSEVTHFLFGKNASPLSLSLFDVRAIELIIDSNKELDSNFNSQYRLFSRSYVGFIDDKGNSIVMATINFSLSSNRQTSSIFNSESPGETQVLFVNLTRRTCLTLFGQ